MGEKKGQKYLGYALGEIILVVIGILIALSINNWNERHKTRNWEAQFLKDLHNELLSDLKHLEQVHNNQKMIRETSTQAINYLKRAQKSDFHKLDSVYALSQSFNPTFFPTTGVYDSGMSSGKIEELRNDELKYAIMNLYNHYYRRVVYNGEILDNVVGKVDWEKIKYFDKSTEKIRSWKAAMDFEFLAQVDYRLAQVNVYTRLTGQTLDEMNKVISIIEKDINH